MGVTRRAIPGLCRNHGSTAGAHIYKRLDRKIRQHLTIKWKRITDPCRKNNPRSGFGEIHKSILKIKLAQKVIEKEKSLKEIEEDIKPIKR